MKIPAKIAKVIGSPGCGKTTYLLYLIEQACKKYSPERIGAVSYTNNAVEEIKNRIYAQTNIKNKETIKNVRTMHSHCFRLLGLSKEQVAETPTKIKEFNAKNPLWELPVNTKMNEDDTLLEEYTKYRVLENKKKFAKITILRNQMIDVNDWVEIELRQMYFAWLNFLIKNNYYDYTKMLEDVLLLNYSPDIDILFVDETQDLSKLQLQILLMWADNVISTTFCGDANQAIFRFAGACVEVFRDLSYTWFNNLEQSYRVPVAVKDYAMKVLSQAKDREEVNYNPTKEMGNIIHCNIPDLTLSGKHMIITRCNYHLNKWKQFLLKNNCIWYNPYRDDKSYNPMNSKGWKTIVAYIKLKNNVSITVKEVKLLIGHTWAKKYLVRGFKEKLKKKEVDIPVPESGLMDLKYIMSMGIFINDFNNMKIPITDKLNLTANIKKIVTSLNDGDILIPREIIIGTIHSVKGGECDNVWIDTSTSLAALREMKQKNIAYNDEVRIAYVAITRAKKFVGIMNSNGYKNYVFL